MEYAHPLKEIDDINDETNGIRVCQNSIQNDSSVHDAAADSPNTKELPVHCLICNGPCIQKDEFTFNIFGKLRTAQGSSRASVFEKVGQILGRTLCSINLHSEIVCHRCFNLLVEYEATESKLQLIRSELVYKFDDTANIHQLSRNSVPKSSKEDDSIVNRTRETSLGEESEMYKSIFIINEEGKLVDENGKEREDPVNLSALKDNKVSKVKGRTLINRTTSKNKSKPYVCSVCGKGFRAFSHRVEHMLIHLGEKPWSCEECKKTFRTKSALRVHSMKHTGERPFTCQQCGKSYVDRCYFEEHCRVHSGERPFVCLFCRRHFARKKDLVIHMKTHTGDKPYMCTLCPKTFAVKSRLDRHTRIHSGEKPHPCEYCGKSFARKDDYKVHVRQHTGERPFHCGYCTKTFTNQSNRLAHVRTHTGVKSYRCSICNEGFSRRLKLDKHVAEKHPGEENVQISVSQKDAAEVDVQPIAEPLESECHTAVSQPLLHADTLQSINVSDLHAIQALPVSQVAQVTWSDNLVPGTTTTTYVNLVPGTYVNIIN